MIEDAYEKIIFVDADESKYKIFVVNNKDILIIFSLFYEFLGSSTYENYQKGRKGHY